MPLPCALLSAFLCAGCASWFGPGLPVEPPPLFDMEEPLWLQGEPADEAKRQQLPAGAYSGVYVGDARASLEGLLGDPEGVLVTRVIENSPGDAAGIEVDDLLLEVGRSDRSGEVTVLQWKSQWRDLELECASGTELTVLLDRAGVERSVRLSLAPRVRLAAREPTERLRETQRVGVVVRTATEVEARAAGLGPGGGAVIVGLSQGSPWRAAGLQFGDLIVAVDGHPLADPQMLLQEIAAAPADERLTLKAVRDGERVTFVAALSERVSELRKFSIPLLFSYSKDRDVREYSALLWLFQWETTPAAWEFTFLWFFTVAGSDADRLEVVDH